APAQARMRRLTRLAWSAAAAIALVLALVGHDRNRQTAGDATVASSAATAADPAAAGSATARPSAATAPPDASLAPLPLEQRRTDLAEAIATLPHVLATEWTTESTLRVDVDDDDFDPKERLCPLLEADPDLRASRIQLQAPSGSTRPVRFLQCRPY